MKKFIFTIIIAILFLGCGSGGGTKTSSGPVLAEATTKNAFRAYDGMSVATYLPSLFSGIYAQITDGSDSDYACSNNGTISVRYVTLPDYIDTSFIDYLGSYEFNECLVNVSGVGVLLNGKIISYSMSVESGDVIIGYIKSGFEFEIENDVSLVYKAFPFSEVSEVMEYFEEDGQGSYFTVDYPSIGGIMTNHHSAYVEEKLGDIQFSGSFANTYNMIGIDENLKGIIASGALGHMAPVLLPRDTSYWGKLLVYINKNEYFETNYDDVEDTTKAVLSGKDDKNVTVWQDETETVYAEDENGVDISYTTHTPSF